jgi:hypothetical protein
VAHVGQEAAFGAAGGLGLGRGPGGGVALLLLGADVAAGAPVAQELALRPDVVESLRPGTLQPSFDVL